MKAVIAMDLNEVQTVDDDTVIYTVLTKNNKNWANEHKGIGVYFIKMPPYIKFGDKVVNTFVQKALKIKNEYNDMLRFVYFSHMVSFYISSRDYEKVYFENQILCEKVMLQFDNSEKYGDDKVEIL